MTHFTFHESFFTVVAYSAGTAEDRRGGIPPCAADRCLSLRALAHIPNKLAPNHKTSSSHLLYWFRLASLAMR